MLPLVLMGAGMAIQAYGQFQADSDQQEAEIQNAKFYRSQALFYEKATRREISIFDKKAAKSFGDTIGAYASSGLALSGSALDVLAGERVAAVEERDAIKLEGDFRANLARMRADQSEDVARGLETSKYLGLAGSLLSSGSRLADKKG